MRSKRLATAVLLLALPLAGFALALTTPATTAPIATTPRDRPQVMALASSGRVNGITRLWYRASDDEGRVHFEVLIWLRGREVARFTTPLLPVRGDDRYLIWHSSVAGRYRFCLRGTDPHGNRGVWTCAYAIVSLPSASAAVRRIAFTAKVEAGQYASLTVRVSPPARCTIEVVYDTVIAHATGLEAKSGGTISWRWRVDASTHPGSWPVTVRCGKSGTLSLRLRVVGSGGGASPPTTTGRFPF
ncbi:MAG: hypothetical protein ACXVZO_05155 [Gaiellaceae bacterium]